MNKTLKQKFKIIGAVISVGGAIITAVGLMGYNSLVIYTGLWFADFVRTAGIVLCASGVITTSVSMLPPPKESQPVIEQNKPILQISGHLDPDMIREQYQHLYQTEYAYISALSAPHDHIMQGFDMMNRYQDKLNVLIKQNGAAALSDTEDVLDKVEQQLCQNVRKLINIMIVSSAAEPNEVIDAANTCVKDNHTLLVSAKDFMTAIATYLNAQGDDQGIDEIQIYKDVLLKQLQQQN
ncbi:hypothetical protein [Butyrivibrio sp.]|uniref:hypothetical protein n=1 Tax=Butyrivibrio sp. TaxID=28121 RepID=UPI0025BEDC2F|nr:hypothetical protein [Butyrivibrio sp.]MBQ9304125.1 hypothetical protein [Butyrivibrio sp.]